MSALVFLLHCHTLIVWRPESTMRHPDERAPGISLKQTPRARDASMEAKVG